MYVVFFIFVAINLYYICRLMLLMTGWATEHIQLPLLNWMNEKFGINYRYCGSTQLYSPDDFDYTDEDETEDDNDIKHSTIKKEIILIDETVD